MSGLSDDQLSCDAFLGGRVHLWQPRSGYRAGVDPVLLAAAIPAGAGQSVLELGCGAGAAILCLAARVPDLRLTGVELQPDYADLARRNAARNQQTLTVIESDLRHLPAEIRQQRFDHILANPPYFRQGAHSPARDVGRHTAMGEATPLPDWLDIAARRLAPRGYLHMIQRVDRIPEMLGACQGRLGSLELLPLAARTGRAPELAILRARKDGRAAFRLHGAVTLHEGDRHDRDGAHFAPAIHAVLRDGAALHWPT
ncbi:MAG: methyltransferase domain-containing protein [Pseudomonadota bacterium]